MVNTTAVRLAEQKQGLAFAAWMAPTRDPRIRVLKRHTEIFVWDRLDTLAWLALN